MTYPGASTLRYAFSQMIVFFITQYVVNRTITISKLTSLASVNTWNIGFNNSKCHIMSITNRRVISIHLYSMLGHILSRVDNSQYLGITIASNLHWENHIMGLTAKASRMLGFLKLRRNLRTCPQQLHQLATSA